MSGVEGSWAAEGRHLEEGPAQPTGRGQKWQGRGTENHNRPSGPRAQELVKDDTKDGPAYQKCALIYSRVWTLSWGNRDSFGNFSRGMIWSVCALERPPRYPKRGPNQELSPRGWETGAPRPPSPAAGWQGKYEGTPSTELGCPLWRDSGRTSSLGSG